MAPPWTYLTIQQLRCHSWLLSFPHCYNWTIMKSSPNYIINVSIYISAHCWVIAIPNNCLFSFYSWPLWSFLLSVFTVSSINFISNEVTSRTVLKHWPLTHLVKIWALFVFHTHIIPSSLYKILFPFLKLKSDLYTGFGDKNVGSELRSILSVHFPTGGHGIMLS